MAATITNGTATPSAKARAGLLKLSTRVAARQAAKHLHAPRELLAGLADRAGNGDGVPLAQRLRSVPIQCSIDIAVPLEVTYAEWTRLDFLPEGAHRIEEIRRRGDRLKGRIVGALAQHSDWRAEVREERPNESFAWRSLKGSDCLGLATFHRLAERLTRVEVELDVVPKRSAEAFELVVHVADRRAETDLRRFKARLERISPEDYASLVDDGGRGARTDNDEED